VIASKERLFMFFKNCLPFLTMLAGRLVVFLTALPRYVYTCCCTSLASQEHALNRSEPGFEDDFRKALAECKDHYKNFLFTSGLRGFAVRNPGLCVPEVDEDGMRLWNEDPVHPTPEGYSRIVEITDAERLRGKAGGKKRAGSVLEAASKRPRGMRCLGRTGLLRHKLPPPGKMVLDAEVTMDDLHSEAVVEAVVEAVAGSEAEATTEGEDAVWAADTRMEEGEAACILVSLSSLSLRIQNVSTAFFPISKCQ
jgi:hypothetical protein